MRGANGTAERRLVDRLSDLVTAQLEPGARLPSEAELAASYGVSRLTIREALRELSGRGLIDISQGRRAMVREYDGRALGQFLTTVIEQNPRGMIDLLEVRRALEVQAASLAARRITRAGLTAIRTMLVGMEAANAALVSRRPRDDAERQFHDCDVGFHEALALASGNRILAHMVEALAKPLRDAFRMSLKGREQRGGTIQEVLEAHKRIFAAVEAGDARLAAQAMREHLDDAARDARTFIRRSNRP